MFPKYSLVMGLYVFSSVYCVATSKICDDALLTCLLLLELCFLLRVGLGSRSDVDDIARSTRLATACSN